MDGMRFMCWLFGHKSIPLLHKHDDACTMVCTRCGCRKQFWMVMQ